MTSLIEGGAVIFGKNPLLDVRAIGKRFGAHIAVHDVSFAVDPGEVVGLLGPNGSGKTTTMYLLIGLLDPSAGSVSVEGISPRSPAARRSIGFVPDDLPLPAALTGGEYLDLNDELRGTRRPELRDELVELFALGRHLHRPVSDYSHGMKRKIQIVAATSAEPRLLLLDEPHRGLDPEAAAILRTLISMLTERGTAVVVATHDLLRAGHDCERVVILHEGHRIAEGTPAEVCRTAARPDLEQAFLRLTGIDSRVDVARRRLHATNLSPRAPSPRAGTGTEGVIP
jgi:ABC-2 type transport system ATP-binding protein